MKKILAILRVSTEKQELESQKLELASYIKTKGFKDKEIQWLEAKGASARMVNEKYKMFLDDIKTIIKNNPSIKAVAMWSLNRLGRVESKLMEMKEFFINNKIQVYCMNPNISLFDEHSGEVSIGMSVAFSMYAAMVKLDTDEMFSKCDRGRRQSAKEGKYIGGYINFGYKIANKHIVIDEEEASLVRKVFTMYSNGEMSCAKIAKELDRQGYTVRNRRDKTKRTKITMNTISKMIHNKAYLGTKKTAKFEIQYPPIISQVLWNKCRLVASKNNKVSDKSYKNYHLGNNIIKCPFCGYGYLWSHNVYQCYKHRARYRFKDDCTESVPIRDTVIDPIIMSCAVEFANLYAHERKVDSIRKYKTRINELRKKIEHSESLIETDYEEKKKRLNELYIDDKIGKQYYTSKTDEIEAMIKIEKARINEYKKEYTNLRSMVDGGDIEEKQYELSQIRALGDCKEKKDFVNEYIEKVWIFKDRIEVYPKFGKRMVITTPDYYYDGDELQYNVIEYDKRMNFYPTFIQ